MGVFRFEGIDLEDAPKQTVPRCPYWRRELERLWIKSKGIGIVEQKQIILCPEYECFLGFWTFSVG